MKELLCDIDKKKIKYDELYNKIIIQSLRYLGDNSIEVLKPSKLEVCKDCGRDVYRVTQPIELVEKKTLVKVGDSYYISLSPKILKLITPYTNFNDLLKKNFELVVRRNMLIIKFLDEVAK